VGITLHSDVSDYQPWCPAQVLSKNREQRSGGKIRDLQSHVAKLVTECAHHPGAIARLAKPHAGLHPALNLMPTCCTDGYVRTQRANMAS
jgi:hypothetical protein